MRRARPDDYAEISTVVDAWWGGRQMAGLLQPLFLENFSSTSLVAESDHRLTGFLVGFVSADDPRLAYVHFAGVAPEARGAGLGRALYERFDEIVSGLGVQRIRCVTSVVNAASVSFHRAIGFGVTGQTAAEGVDGGQYVHLERDVVTLPSSTSSIVMWPPRQQQSLAGNCVEASPTTIADAPELFAALDDERVWRHLTVNRPHSPDEMSAIIESACSSMFPWTVRVIHPVSDVRPGTVVGWSSYLEVSEPNARLEVGSTAYSPAVWGSVVNAEVKLLLLGHAFGDLGVGRVQLKTDIRNERSQKAIERLGATREGVLRQYQRRPDGTMRDTVVYSITAHEWPEVQQSLRDRVGAGIKVKVIDF